MLAKFINKGEMDEITAECLNIRFNAFLAKLAEAVDVPRTEIFEKSRDILAKADIDQC